MRPASPGAQPGPPPTSAAGGARSRRVHDAVGAGRPARRMAEGLGAHRRPEVRPQVYGVHDRESVPRARRCAAPQPAHSTATQPVPFTLTHRTCWWRAEHHTGRRPSFDPEIHGYGRHTPQRQPAPRPAESTFFDELPSIKGDDAELRPSTPHRQRTDVSGWSADMHWTMPAGRRPFARAEERRPEVLIC